MQATKGQPSKRTLAKQAKGKQIVSMNVFLGNARDEVLAVACKQVGLHYRRVRAGKEVVGQKQAMERHALPPDTEFRPTWEITDPNALGKQVIERVRDIFEGQTRANGRELADLR